MISLLHILHILHYNHLRSFVLAKIIFLYVLEILSYYYLIFSTATEKSNAILIPDALWPFSSLWKFLPTFFNLMLGSHRTILIGKSCLSVLRFSYRIYFFLIPLVYFLYFLYLQLQKYVRLLKHTLIFSLLSERFFYLPILTENCFSFHVFNIKGLFFLPKLFLIT